jgi:transcriptional regulator with XRE-family HTH domain
VPADPRPDWVSTSRQRIGLRIAHLRAARGLSVDGLADAAGLDRKSVMRAEAGSRYVRLDTLLMLARGLGLSLAELVAEDDPAADTGVADGGE